MAGGRGTGGIVALDGEVVVRYDAVYGPPEPSDGTRRLLLAVLEEGIRTLLRNARATQVRPRRLRRDALRWMLNPAQANVFGFGAICDALGIDPGRLRRQVLRRLAEAEEEAGTTRPRHER